MEVDFISFEDVKNGELKKYDVIMNAGHAGTAWSGKAAWKDETMVSKLYQWVYEGGTFIGIDQPSAVEGYDSFYRMAPVLGLDEDNGAKVCHGKWTFETVTRMGLLPEGCFVKQKENRFLTDGNTNVLLAHNGNPDMTIHEFGNGYGIYMGGFTYTPENTRMLLNLLLYVSEEKPDGMYLTDNVYTECSYYPEIKKLVVVNNSEIEQKTSVKTEKGILSFTIEAFGQTAVDV